ncbi:MAG: hypothetical protein Q9181_005813, partial [Wetmoreana brouardii]
PGDDANEAIWAVVVDVCEEDRAVELEELAPVELESAVLVKLLEVEKGLAVELENVGMELVGVIKFCAVGEEVEIGVDVWVDDVVGLEPIRSEFDMLKDTDDAELDGDAVEGAVDASEEDAVGEELRLDVTDVDNDCERIEVGVVDVETGGPLYVELNWLDDVETLEVEVVRPVSVAELKGDVGELREVDSVQPAVHSASSQEL